MMNKKNMSINFPFWTPRIKNECMNEEKTDVNKHVTVFITFSFVIILSAKGFSSQLNGCNYYSLFSLLNDIFGYFLRYKFVTKDHLNRYPFEIKFHA